MDNPAILTEDDRDELTMERSVTANMANFMIW